MKVVVWKNTHGIHIAHQHGNPSPQRLPLDMFYGILDVVQNTPDVFDFEEDLWVPASLTPHYNRRDWIILHDALQRSLSENN